MLFWRLLPVAFVLPACAPPSTGDSLEESFDFDTRVEIHDTEPTVVVVSWTTETPGPSWVEFGVDGALDRTTSVEDDGTTEHEFRLVGLPASTEVQFRAVSESDGVESASTGTAWTREFPPHVPRMGFGALDHDLAAPNAYVAASVFGATTGTLVADREGSVLWFWQQPGNVTIPKMELRNGSTELIAMVTPAAFGTQNAQIRIFSIADGSEQGFTLTGGAHHAFTQLPDGSIAYIHADIREWENPLGEVVKVAGDAIAIRSPDGDTRDLFTIWDWQAPAWNEWWGDGYFAGASNWTHANALDYDPNTDTLLLSMRNTRSVVEVDVGSGEVVRWFGTREGYGFAVGTQPFAFQHDVKWSRAGTLLASITDDRTTFSVEYEVDEDRRRLSEVWSFGEDLGFFAEVHGGIEELDNGNRLINWGTRPEIREVTTDTEVAWDVAVKGDYGLMSVIPFEEFYDLQ